MANIVDPNGPYFCDIETNPVPEGAKVGYFKTSDNVQLRYGIWPKTDGPSKGTICLVQGRSEYIEKYFETIADFQRRGFQVATFDWRGQGGSERLIGNKKLGYVAKFDDYWLDLSSFYGDILLPDCPGPYYLVGHSMGGFVGLLAGARDRMMFDRMFLSAPMIAVDGLPMSMAGTATLLEGLCFAGLGQFALPSKDNRSPSAETFPGNTLTSDFERYMRTVDAYAACPELEIGAPTIRWSAAACRASARAAAADFPDRVKVPVLLLAAARDKVVSTSAIEHMGLRMRTGRHAVIAQARHELFMENDDIRGQVFAAFDAFITEQSS